jgi:hypothetical protein
MQAHQIKVGRRVRKHLPYHDAPEGVIVEIRGELKGRQPRPGVMQIIRADDATFDVVTFDGRRFTCREHDVGRPGIGCVDLLEKVHGPALIAKALELHAERTAREARERAEAPVRMAEQQAAQVIEQAPLFYWNGIKDAKGARLQRAWYTDYGPGGSVTGRFPAHTIGIHARDYARFSPLVAACFVVENNTDTMTDYFDNDSIHVTPAHPLYPQVRAAYEAQETHRAKRAGGAR